MRWVAWNTASGDKVPVAQLVSSQSGSSSSWKSGIRGTQASVVEVCMPEFSFVEISLGRTGRVLRDADVDNALRQCFKQRKESLVVCQVSI